MDLVKKFIQHKKENFPFLHPANCYLILAVSGGIDSVVMTDIFLKLNFNFIIAHCNFHLRGDESNRDEVFVNELAAKYQKQIQIKHFETEKYSKEKKISLQEAARDLRYEWFAELMSNYKSSSLNHSKSIFLCTAHNVDDNIETLLINFFRGTGIRGLTGIPEIDKNRKIIRPLLFASRDEIKTYAKENRIEWVEDSSNKSDKYARNFFRNQIIPAISERYPDVKTNLTNNIHRFKEVAELYSEIIDRYKNKLLIIKENEYHIPILKLQNSTSLNTLLFEIVNEFGFHSSQLPEIRKLFEANNGSYVASHSHRIIKNRKWLIIAPLQSEQSQHILIENGTSNVSFAKGNLHLSFLNNEKISTNPNIATLDAKEIQFPLLLRRHKQGDYFYPLGMRKKKKLSRFFIDQKLSKTEKENIWVIEMDKKIIWIINHRIDDRFKITPSTSQVLQITFQEKKL